MKRILILMVLFTAAQITFAQRSLPKVDLKTMDNTVTSTDAFDNEGKPIVISFWALV